jgi:hypothetical protein
MKPKRFGQRLCSSCARYCVYCIFCFFKRAMLRYVIWYRYRYIAYSWSTFANQVPQAVPSIGEVAPRSWYPSVAAEASSPCALFVLGSSFLICCFFFNPASWWIRVGLWFIDKGVNCQQWGISRAQLWHVH